MEKSNQTTGGVLLWAVFFNFGSIFIVRLSLRNDCIALVGGIKATYIWLCQQISRLRIFQSAGIFAASSPCVFLRRSLFRWWRTSNAVHTYTERRMHIHRTTYAHTPNARTPDAVRCRSRLMVRSQRWSKDTVTMLLHVLKTFRKYWIIPLQDQTWDGWIAVNFETYVFYRISNNFRYILPLQFFIVPLHAKRELERRR